MNVSLTSELEQLAPQKAPTGEYGSASDVVREALRLMEERERFEALRKDEIGAQIDAGLASLRAGRIVDGEAVFERLEREMAAEERGGAA